MPNKKIELSKINTKAIDNFEQHLKSAGINNEDTLRNYISACKLIFDITKKDINKFTKKDIDKAFSSNRMKPTTKEIYKQKFVKFLEFNNKNDLAKYVKTLFNFEILKEPTKTSDDVLSKSELNQIINSAKSLRDKAIIEIFVTTGGRRKEINQLKYKDIQITESIIWVTIDKSKSKPRRIPIVANENIETSIYPRNLVDFYNTHIFKNDKEKPLFYSNQSNHYGEPLNKNSINIIVKKIIKNSKINKNITPHILRHTSATYDGYFLTEQDLCLKYGWRIGSRQPKTYCHMTETHLGEHLLKLSGTTEEQIKKDSKCPQCKQTVNINDKICKYCNYILDRTLQNEEIEKLRNEKEEISTLKNDIFQQNLKHNKEIKTLKNINKKYEEKFKKFEQILDNSFLLVMSKEQKKRLETGKITNTALILEMLDIKPEMLGIKPKTN